ncbi:hypothetical protein [Roseibium sp.]|uniref:hypothetical protein n=1 Tax=Roseibium sp. TaxID=1936156 RepID=UPI003A97FD74
MPIVIFLRDLSMVFALAAVTLLPGTATGVAQSFPYSSDQPLDYHFSSFRTCYGRVYSQSHMQKHPQQKVAQISLSHFPNRQELLAMDSAFQPYPDTPKLVLELSLMRRNVAPYDPEAVWTEKALCEPEGARLHCRIECDGGDFYVEEKRDSILLTGGSDLYFTQCDAGDKVLERLPDDKTFELFLLPASHCSAR